jgi:hypothetical protein
MEQGTRNKEQGAGNREQGTFQTAVAPLKSGTTAPANRPSAFEQAKAIQQANRASRVSMANPVSQTVELGAVNTVSQNDRSGVEPLIPRQSISVTPHESAPAPRAISFEPAKIDAFSFGESPAQPAPLTLPAQWKTSAPQGVPNDNVGEVSFSTKHVMPAEKEESERIAVAAPARIATQIVAGGPVVRQPAEYAVREENAKPLPTLPLERGGGVNGGATAPSVLMPVQKTVTPVNRFRITPTGHRDEVASDDTPSPHVVDLRN